MRNKLVFILLSACIIPTVAYAQNPSREVLEQGLDAGGRIRRINLQIDSLKDEIHRDFRFFGGQPLYTDKSAQKTAFNELDVEKNELREKIDTTNEALCAIQDDLKWVYALRDHYDNHSIDSLFSSSDLVSLSVHQAIFGDSYPKVMDDLRSLLECKALFTREYDADDTSAFENKLEGIPSCQSKDYLEDLLVVFKDVSDEVKYWIDEEEHSLYSMLLFHEYLMENFGVELNADFPHLAQMVRDALQAR